MVSIMCNDINSKKGIVKHSIFLSVFLFSIILFGFVGNTIYQSYQTQEQFVVESLKKKAITIFNLIVDLRHWNAEFGGVYVKSDLLAPNPYLKPSYILSEKKEKMVWINPAFMTRQISDIASKRDGFTLKITSDKLINKHNAPNKQEKQMLEYFLKNPDVPYFWKFERESFYFMGALKTEKSCLKCHRKQGYKEGDVRGGISVTFDIAKELSVMKSLRFDMKVAFGILFLLALALLATIFLYQRSRQQDEQKITRMNMQLEQQVQALDQFNAELSGRVESEVKKRRQQDRLLIQQSKLAALGEMIANIAHQWRQPINAVSVILMNIKFNAMAQNSDSTFLQERLGEADEQLNYMSQTIEDFRTFFAPDKKKEYFDLYEVCMRSYHIVQATFEIEKIDFQMYRCKDMTVYGYGNECAQVLLNLLSNAKDILLQRAIAKPKIVVSILCDEAWVECSVCDNAGGIEDAIMDRIFEPYFTTKGHGGTGIGLYIVKEIVEKHMRGKISVKNDASGACFTIALPRRDHD